jgi:hypothetical protein
MSKRDGIQLAVGEPAGLRGNLYAIWFGPRDIYIAANDRYEDWKTSIHYESPHKAGRLRYSGISSAFAKKLKMSASRPDRTALEWPGIELRPGSDYYLEFRLRVPQSELRPLGEADLMPLNSGEPLDIRWLPAPPPGLASEVSIITGPPSHVGERPRREDYAADVLVLERQLANGRLVWLIQHVIPAPPSDALDAFRRKAAKQSRTFPRRGNLSAHREIVAMNCEDGSAAFGEFATDFPRRGPRATRTQVSA